MHPETFLQEVARRFRILQDLGEDVSLPRGDTLPSPTDIDAVEEALGVRFPEDYRRYMLKYGGGGLSNQPMCEIFPSHPTRKQAGEIYWETIHARMEHGLRIDRAVILRDEDMGVLDCLVCAGDASSVVSLVPDEGEGHIAASFSDYVISMLAAAEERIRDARSTVAKALPSRSAIRDSEHTSSGLTMDERSIADLLVLAGHRVTLTSEGLISELRFGNAEVLPLAAREALARAHSLRKFSTEGNHLRFDNLRVLAKLTTIREVRVAHSQVTNPDLGEMEWLEEMEVLDISRNHITPAGLAAMSPKKKVVETDCSHTFIQAHYIRIYFPNVRTLIANNVPVDAKKGLKLPPSVSRLSIAGCNVTDAHVDDILACHDLRVLDIRGTSITRSGIEDILTAKSLREISVASDLAREVDAAIGRAGRGNVSLSTATIIAPI